MDEAKIGLKQLLAMLALTAIFAVAAYIYTPGLWTDLRTSDWRPALGLKLEDAKCKSYYFVVSTCTIKYSNPSASQQRATSLDYLALGRWGGERAMLVQSASRPEHVSILIATQKLASRSFALMAIALIPLIMLCVAFARLMPQSRDEELSGLAAIDDRALEDAAAQAKKPQWASAARSAPSQASGSGSFGRRGTTVR